MAGTVGGEVNKGWRVGLEIGGCVISQETKKQGMSPTLDIR